MNKSSKKARRIIGKKFEFISFIFIWKLICIPVAMYQFLSIAPIKRYPCSISAIRWYTYLELQMWWLFHGNFACLIIRRISTPVSGFLIYLQFDTSRNNNRPEWQRVRANWGNHDSRNWRMYHRCPCSDSICSTSGWRWNNQAITLHRSN